MGMLIWAVSRKINCSIKFNASEILRCRDWVLDHRPLRKPRRHALIWPCPGQSQTCCFTTSSCRSRTCGATVETECSSVAAIRTVITRRTRRQRLSRPRGLWPDALYSVRSSRRRRWPVMAASWLIGPAPSMIRFCCPVFASSSAFSRGSSTINR